MIALSNRTYVPDHMLYEHERFGREFPMVESQSEGHIVKDFMLGDTRIKICDDYCLDKTPKDIQSTLERIASKTYPVLSMQGDLERSEVKQEA